MPNEPAHTSPDPNVTTSTLRKPEGHRRSYRKTIRRIIGTPQTVESEHYALPLTRLAEEELDGFRAALEDFGYAVVIVETEGADGVKGARWLRGWAPRTHAWWLAPFTAEHLEQARRFEAQFRALGYVVDVERDEERLEIRCRFPLPEHAESVQ